MSQLSEFHFYSMGIVAANKELSSKEIEVFPIEIGHFANGEITDNASSVLSSAQDASGATYSTNTTTTNSIKAVWLPIGNSNRMTAPDVRRGEKVMIYRFADTDKFYWQVHNNDMDLRKLETVIYAFSATTDEGAKTDSDNSYFLEISTHSKLMHLHTSNKNGEPFIYDIQINAGTGFIQIQDDQGNYIKFDTVAHQILLSNQDGSSVEVNKANINMTCPDSINMKSSVLNINCPTINSTGVVAQTGNVAIDGNTTMNGDATSTGSITAPTFNGFLNGNISGSDND